jgi:hypothetical protein
LLEHAGPGPDLVSRCACDGALTALANHNNVACFYPSGRAPLEPPIFKPQIDLFTVDKLGAAICGSCGGGYAVTACIAFCSAARTGEPHHDRRVFLCAGCLLEASELLAGFRGASVEERPLLECSAFIEGKDAG